MEKKIFEKMHKLACKLAKENNDLIKKTGYSTVACVIMGESGKLYTGINVAWDHCFCAEIIALGNALQAGERKMKYSVGVKFNKRNNQLHSVTPCGVCREMFNQVCPEIKIAYIDNNEIEVKSINQMLPEKEQK